MTAFEVQPSSQPLSGSHAVPGDKSIGHRAVIFSSLCRGPVEIRGLSQGADNRSTLAAMSALGVGIEGQGEHLLVRGVGLDGLRRPESAIDCGNAGTGMRLLGGLAAGQAFPVTLTGDESLIQRPMKRIAIPLSTMGASIEGRETDGNIYPPLTICGGGLHGISYRSPVASAQVKSAILLAGLYADGVTSVIEPGSSRDHSERMLRYLGAPIDMPQVREVRLDTRGWSRLLEASTLEVPGDPSSAAFVIAAALIAGADRVLLPDVCVNTTRTGFLDVLSSMAGAVEVENRRERCGEEIAQLAVSDRKGDEIRPTRIAGDLTVRAIDEIPILAVVAAFADGVSEFADAGELRVKESDRIATTCAMLREFGIDVEERNDGFSVAGRVGRRLRSARIDSHGDHRIAMAAAVAAMRAEGCSRIDNVENVATSFPGFAETMNQFGTHVRVLQ